jgi:hypothetical protein
VAYITNPKFVEAMAARRGVNFAVELGLQSITLEGDAPEIASAIRNEAEGSKTYGGVVHDIRVKLSSFHLWDVSFVPRGGSTVAHELAKLAVAMTLHQVWFDTYPSSLFEYLRNDRCNLSH